MEPDKYGHCCFCHKDLIEPRVVGGKQVMMFNPDFDQTEFVISNKSRMVVCLCKKCQEKHNLHDADVHNKIMESVIAGWELEPSRKPEGYKDLRILFHSQDIDDYVVRERFQKLGV